MIFFSLFFSSFTTCYFMGFFTCHPWEPHVSTSMGITCNVILLQSSSFGNTNFVGSKCVHHFPAHFLAYSNCERYLNNLVTLPHITIDTICLEDNNSGRLQLRFNVTYREILRSQHFIANSKWQVVTCYY